MLRISILVRHLLLLFFLFNIWFLFLCLNIHTSGTYIEFEDYDSEFSVTIRYYEREPEPEYISIRESCVIPRSLTDVLDVTRRSAINLLFDPLVIESRSKKPLLSDFSAATLFPEGQGTKP